MTMRTRAFIVLTVALAAAATSAKDTQAAVARDHCVDKGDPNAVADGNWCKCKTGFEYLDNNQWSTKYHINQGGRVQCQAAVCPAGSNCFVGPAGGAWFASVSQWSTAAYPAFPNVIELRKPVTLRKPSKAGARELVLKGKGDLVIKGSKTDLTLGPRRCRSDQVQHAAPTATSNRICYTKSEFIGTAGAAWQTQPPGRPRRPPAPLPARSPPWAGQCALPPWARPRTCFPRCFSASASARWQCTVSRSLRACTSICRGATGAAQTQTRRA